MLEQEYLELCEELKKKHEALEQKERDIKVIEGKLKVDMATIFGLVRAGDRLLNNLELPDDFLTIWELICNFVFTSTKVLILDVPVQEQPLELSIRVINEEPVSDQQEPNPESEPEND